MTGICDEPIKSSETSFINCYKTSIKSYQMKPQCKGTNPQCTLPYIDCKTPLSLKNETKVCWCDT